MNTTKAGLIAAGLMGVAAVSSTMFAIREVRAQRDAEAALAELMRPAAGTDGRTVGVDTAARPAPANAVASAASPSRPVVSPGDRRRADGEAFLRRHPEVRGMLVAQFRAQVARNHALFYRKARLTAAQIESFEDRLVARKLDTLEVTPSGINAGQSELPVSELAVLFGAEGLRQWQEFQRERVSDYFARNIALAIKNGADPLTADQLVQVMSSVSRNSPEFRAGGTVDPATVDWTAALAQVANVLSAEQWREGQPWLQKTYVDARLKTLAGITP